MPSQPAHVTARQAALIPEIIVSIAREVEKGRPADGAMAALFRAHREFGSRDRRLFSQLVFSWFRWLGWLRDMEPARAAALAWTHDTGETHPAVDLLLGDGPREWVEKDITLLAPEWLRDELHDDFERFIRAIQERPPTWLRVRKESLELVKAEVGTALPWPTRVGSGGPAFRHSGGAVGHRALPVQTMDLAGLRKKHGPVFEVQDLASQCVGVLCEPAPGEAWWDVCAGAGGKTLHLAELMEGKGRILATDIRDSALKELERRAREAGAGMITTAPVTDQPSPVTAYDGVLIDAPCSGIGTWSRNPDMRWRTARETIAEKAAIQAGLLDRCSDAVKPGGRLVYAVCTVTRAETEDVVQPFLARHEEFVLEPGAHPLSGAESDGTFWIWPWDGPCDGMYIARMKRAATQYPG